MSGFDYDAAASRIAREFQSVGKTAKPEPTKGEGSFGSVLDKLVSETDAMQHEADKAVTDLVSGEKQNVHEVMLTMAKADVSFRMMLEVRNKLVEAYQEVMRMQV